jgi:hypothetical protein
MTEHNLFYYPYASFTNQQLVLLKVAALWFDKLVILDPVGASWNTVGADHVARDAVLQLRDAGILEIVRPAALLAKHEQPIVDAIRRDIVDREFLDLCDAESQTSGKHRWTLSLAKVPQDLQADRIMRNLMGDIARDFANKAAYAVDDYIEHVEALSSLPGRDQPSPLSLLARAKAYREYAKTGQAYDEYREGYDADVVEYRYADFPLALGEAIMMNHALFASLLHADATPITDDPFHSRVLGQKLRRAVQEPTIGEARTSRARQTKLDLLAATTLADEQLKLPVFSPELPLSEVLEYRNRHDAELYQARESLGWMARRIEAEPWTEDFAKELEHKTIPDIATQLGEARRVRDAWLNGKRGRLALGAAGIAVGAASAVLSVFAAPLAPVALATAGLSLASGTAIPGAEWLLDWREGKKGLQENGLHYLLKG